MAWSSSVDSGDRLTAMNDLKPCWIAGHCLLESFLGSSTGGVWTETGNTSDANQAASGYPVYRAYDGFAHDALSTKPNAAAATWYLAFDCSSSPITFDSVFIVGTNLDGLDDIIVHIADNATFTTNIEKILGLDTSTNYGVTAGTIGNRNTHTQLDHNSTTPRLYSNVGYVRVKFAVDSGTATPEVTEIWFGQRRQLLDWPDVPWDNTNTSSEIRAIRTRPGLTTCSTRHEGRASRVPTITLGDSSDLAVVTSWWDDCLYGARSFVWVEPVSATVEPVGYLMAYDGPEPDLNPTKLGPNERRVTLPMIELKPFYSQD